MKKRQTNTNRYTEKLDVDALGPQMEKHEHPKSRGVYYIELKSAVGLLHTAGKGGGVIRYR